VGGVIAPSLGPLPHNRGEGVEFRVATRFLGWRTEYSMSFLQDENEDVVGSMVNRLREALRHVIHAA
jgi:hypothetical protein